MTTLVEAEGMSVVTRIEFEARSEAIEARMDTRVAGAISRIDALIARMDERDMRLDGRDMRLEMLVQAAVGSAQNASNPAVRPTRLTRSGRPTSHCTMTLIRRSESMTGAQRRNRPGKSRASLNRVLRKQ